MRPRLGLSLLLVSACVHPACSSDSSGNGNNAATTSSGGVVGNAGAAGSLNTAGTVNGGAAGAMQGGAAGAAGSLAGGSGGALPSGGGGGNAGAGAGGQASAGQAGVGGMAGAAGTAGQGNARSAGCGQTVTELPDEWATHDITVTVDPGFAEHAQRRYFSRPPTVYDQNTAYPLTIWGQGCGQSVAETTPMQLGPAADNSVQVQLLSKNACYSAGPDGDDTNSPELPYFDAVLQEIEAAYCIDTSKIFVGGYSSGGWFTGLMSCARANVVRGVGWAAAGLQNNHPECMGPVAAIITRGVDDGGTPLERTEAARDSILMRNGCGTQTMPWDPGEAEFDSSACVEYQGCMPGYPVVWCPTPGGHTNGLDSGLSSKGFWKLWSSLP